MAKRKSDYKIKARKRTENSYQVRLTVEIDGVSQRKSISGKTKEDAELKARNYIEELKKGICLTSEDITVEKWIEKYLKECCLPRVSPNTLKMYKEVYERYIIPSCISKIKLKKLRREDVQRFINELKLTQKKNGGYISSKTTKHAHGLLRASLKEAVLRNMVIRNVALDISLPREENKKDKVLPSQEYKEWLTYTKEDRYFFIEFLMFTGVRVSELCGLKWRRH